MAMEWELAAAGAPAVSSAALENSHIVVTHQAVLYGIDGRNTDTGNAIYLMVFDAIAVPANGTIPRICVAVDPAGSGATADAGNFGWTAGSSWGERFVKGIVVCASTTDVSSGLTLSGSNKTFFHVEYASEDGLSSS